MTIWLWWHDLADEACIFAPPRRGEMSKPPEECICLSDILVGGKYPPVIGRWRQFREVTE